MFKASENNIIILFLIALTSLVLGLIPFSIYGQDGYSLWHPIIAEYLQGDKIYHSSAVIFNGQNLSAIYGDLPFWKIFRLLNLNVTVFLNLTHAVFLSLLFLSFTIIHQGLKKKTDFYDITVCFLLAGFGPIILNRVWAGHLNLLFVLLPFFAALALFFEQNIKTSVLCFVSFWLALSTCGYQVLSYYIFYLPFLVVLFLDYGQSKAKILGIGILTFGLAFLINLPQFLEMIKHAADTNNARSLNENLVYSYLVTIPQDFFQFFFTGIAPNYIFRPIGYFHEINYGMGLFIFMFAIQERNLRVKIAYFVTFFILILFCMNLAPFNLLSNLPLIKAFRVPQRSFMVLALFVPIWCYSRNEIFFEKKSFITFLVLLVFAQIIPTFEVIALIGVLGLLLVYSNQNFSVYRMFFKKLILALTLSSLFVGAKYKILSSIDFQKQYEGILALISPLREKFSAEKLRKKTFHFETLTYAGLLNFVAQTNGIRTVEGYGHPPKDLLLILSQLTGQPFNITSNHLFFPYRFSKKEELYKAFGIDYEVTLGNDGKLIINKATEF